MSKSLLFLNCARERKALNRDYDKGNNKSGIAIAAAVESARARAISDLGQAEEKELRCRKKVNSVGAVGITQFTLLLTFKRRRV